MVWFAHAICMLGLFEIIQSINTDELEKAFHDLKKMVQETKSTLQYDGPNVMVKLTISDQVFVTSTQVLFDAKHGVTLFSHEFLANNENSINYQCEAAVPKRGDILKTNTEKAKSAEASATDSRDGDRDDEIIHLYFDRDPLLFNHILDYLRGYSMQYALASLDVRALQKLMDDAEYYSIEPLQQMLLESLHSRFDPLRCGSSSQLQISDAGRSLKRIGTGGGMHKSCGVFGVLYSGARYVEFSIESHGNRHFMIGVTEAENFKTGPYPGHQRVPGIALHGSNGHLYRNGGSEPWSAAWNYGDRVGVLVQIASDTGHAQIRFYLNGASVKKSIGENRHTVAHTYRTEMTCCIYILRTVIEMLHTHVAKK